MENTKNNIAVCISGQVRDDGTKLHALLSKLPGADVYCALFDGPLTAKFLDEISPRRSVILEHKPGEYWRNEFLGRADFTEEQKAILLTPDKKRGGCLRDNPLRMFYAIEMCSILPQLYSMRKYDYVVRARPDQRVNRPKYGFDFSGIGEKDIMVPRTGWADYLDYYRSDKFFVGRADFMYKVCGLYSIIHEVASAFPTELGHVWMEPELTLHWAIKHRFKGETVKNVDWDIDRWRVDYKEFTNG